MKKENKDIVYISDGYDSYYTEDLKLGSINKITNNNFNLVSVDKLENIKGKKGFLLILTIDDLYYYFPDVVDIYNPDVYEIDRLFRNLFKNFKHVIIISIEEFDYGKIPFSNIYIEFANKYFGSEEGINLLIDKLYKEDLVKERTKFTTKRLANIQKLNNYISKKRKEFIETKEIIKDLNINEKWLQRHMKDMNDIYNNIGYNKRKRNWYKVKTSTRMI